MQDQNISLKTDILYEQDFYQWIQTTASLLKNRDFNQVDWENLIEEIESMGRSEKRELLNCLITLIEHLLKLQYWEAEKTYNARDWRSTIVEQRRQIEFTLEDSPSLVPILEDVFLDCYRKARNDLLRKSQLSSDMFPSTPSFTPEDVLNSDYFPE